MSMLNEKMLLKALRTIKNCVFLFEDSIEDVAVTFNDLAQSADVVEVVRCADCKWYEILELKKDGTEDRRYKPSFCTLYTKTRKSDYFCADGERREK